MIRDVLLAVHAAAWLIVVVISAWRTGEVSPVLWSALPFGISAVLVAFRAGDDVIIKRRVKPGDGEDP